MSPTPHSQRYPPPRPVVPFGGSGNGRKFLSDAAEALLRLQNVARSMQVMYTSPGHLAMFCERFYILKTEVTNSNKFQKCCLSHPPFADLQCTSAK